MTALNRSDRVYFDNSDLDGFQDRRYRTEVSLLSKLDPELNMTNRSYNCTANDDPSGHWYHSRGVCWKTADYFMRMHRSRRHVVVTAVLHVDSYDQQLGKQSCVFHRHVFYRVSKNR
jgi:hypothetical protein